MPEPRKNFGCPKCAGVVKVPVKYLGKRIKCPKCEFVFRAGPKPKAEPEILAEIDEDFGAGAPAPNYHDPFSDPMTMPLQPLPPAAPLPPTRRAAPIHSRIPARSKKSQPEMTESDGNIQSTGFFLISLPVIATVLPLFGLQLRRLAKLGEFAPLAAMVLGLIGAGCIFYARRNQKDGPLFGGLATAFVLLTGIGGFFMVVTFGSSGNDANGSSQNFTEAESRKMHEEFTERAEKIHREFDAQQRASKRSRDQAQQASEEAVNRSRTDMQSEGQRRIDQMNDRAAEHQRNAREMHDNAMETMRKQRDASGFNNGPGFPNIPTPNFGRGGSGPPRFGGRPD